MDEGLIGRLARLLAIRTAKNSDRRIDAAPISKPSPGFALEPRIMLDAAMVSTGEEILSEPENQQGSEKHSDKSTSSIQAETHKLAEALEASSQIQNTVTEVVLIDPTVPDYQTLIAGISDQAQVHLLSSSASLAEIADVLAGYQNLDAVHIISHGSTGSLALSGETVDSDTLASQRETLVTIGQSLSQEGDILLYGCNVGSDRKGQDFIEQLAALTGADIAASNDLTGSSEKGGDWDFETSVGLITQSVTASELATSGYTSVLAIVNIENLGDVESESNPTEIGQTFRATVSGYITEIQVVSNQDTTPVLKIYSDAGIGDEDTELHSQSVSLTYLEPGGNGYVMTSIVLNKSVAITDGMDYTFYFAEGEGVAPLADLAYTSNTYDNGEIVGDSLQQPENFDLIFRVVQSEGSAPSISISDTSLPYTENDTATLIAATGTVSDLDGDADWNGGKLVAQITSNNEATDRISISDTDGDGIAITVSGTDLLAGSTTIGTVSATGGVVPDGTALTISFNSSATNANVQEVLQSLRYHNTSETPSTENRTITVTATDAGGGFDSDTRTVSVAAVNDAPTVTGTPTDITVTEDAASNIDLSAVTFADPEDDSLTITLTVDAGTLAGSTSSGVTVGGSGTGAMSLSGTAANINTWLDTVANIQYTTAANANGVATLTVSASDGEGGSLASNPTINLNITAVNDAPVVDADPDNSSGGDPGFETSYTAGAASGVVVVDSDFTITDIDNSHIQGAEIMLTGLQNGTNEGITIDNTPATIAGISITYTSATEINLSGAATKAEYESLIRQINYSNSSSAATTTTGNRTVIIQVNDGSSASNSETTTISVVAAPIVTIWFRLALSASVTVAPEPINTGVLLSFSV